LMCIGTKSGDAGAAGAALAFLISGA
jgi:hypothetical protein